MNNSIVRQRFGKSTSFWRCLSVPIGFLLLIGTLIPASAQAGSDAIGLFKEEKYGQAVAVFAEELKKQPDNPKVNFFMGRSFLALSQAGKAMAYLKKAAQMVPSEPDYQFWLGVGYWANMEFEKERQSYLKALQLAPNHLRANLYLGHSHLDRNQWNRALNQYDRVLAINPDVPDALYYRALVLRRLGKSVDEKTAWRSYLNRYRFGKWALHAAEQLNAYGDFSYRIYLFGSRRIVVPAINFESDGPILKPESLNALERIGEFLTKNRALSLHVIAYVKNNPDLAMSHAKSIKNKIMEMFPEIEPSRLSLSWFGVPEEINSKNKTYVLNESVNIFTKRR
jgi:tetratricopeptide (TPR) repeat protein